MQERERFVVTGLLILMLVVWLGFVFHQSPRFAGSFWSGMLALSGTFLMLLPLAYTIVKRIRPLKRALTKRVSMRTLLAWHIYAGILGPIMVLLHTGHKFESPLGIALTAMTLIVVVSGFVGRYLMKQFSQEIREKRAILTELNAAYDQLHTELAAHPEQAALVRPFSGLFTRLAASLFTESSGALVETSVASIRSAVRLSEAIADVEYAIETHEIFKSWFGRWLKVHIVISLILYILLTLHVWGAIHFGLRWFE